MTRTEKSKLREKIQRKCGGREWHCFLGGEDAARRLSTCERREGAVREL